MKELRSESPMCKRTHWFAGLMATVFLVVVCAYGSTVGAQNSDNPLEPPDTTSPRATIATVLSIAQQAEAFMARGEGRTFHNLAERRAMIEHMTSCFDLNDIAPSLRMSAARETAIYLKEIFDRIELPPVSEIPDTIAIAKLPGGLPQWTIPHTEITLVRIKDGLRAGQYVFSS